MSTLEISRGIGLMVPLACIYKVRRFISITARPTDLGHHTEITLQDVPKFKYRLTLFVENEERNLLRMENNRTWLLRQPLYVPCSLATPTP